MTSPTSVVMWRHTAILVARDVADIAPGYPGMCVGVNTLSPAQTVAARALRFSPTPSPLGKSEALNAADSTVHVHCTCARFHTHNYVKGFCSIDRYIFIIILFKNLPIYIYIQSVPLVGTRSMRLCYHQQNKTITNLSLYTRISCITNYIMYIERWHWWTYTYYVSSL